MSLNGPIRLHRVCWRSLRFPTKLEVISRIGLYFEQTIGEMQGTHTGFSPGESSESQTVQTSSGSINAKESPHKVRREIDRLEARTVQAAPALRCCGPTGDSSLIVVDDQSVVSVRSRRSVASVSSSSAELQIQIMEQRRNLAHADLQLLEARARATPSSRSRRSAASHRGGLGQGGDGGDGLAPMAVDVAVEAPAQMAMITASQGVPERPEPARLSGVEVRGDQQFPAQDVAIPSLVSPLQDPRSLSPFGPGESPQQGFPGVGGDPSQVHLTLVQENTQNNLNVKMTCL